MPLLFYSTAADKIEGAAGTKAIYLSDHKALAHFRKLLPVDDTSTGDPPRDIGTEMRDALASGGNDIPAIAEEMHHFRIVRATRAGRLLYMWNPLLRVAFSSQHGRTADWSVLRPSTVHREAIRYFRAQLAFYLAAAPILEAAYGLETDEKEVRRDTMYLAHLTAGRRFLLDGRSDPEIFDPRSGRFRTPYLARVIDRAFVELATGRQAGPELGYEREPALVGWRELILRHRPFMPAVLTPASWPALTRSAARVWRPALVHFLSVMRLAYTDTAAGSGHAGIPGLWCARGVIDPVGFSLGQRAMGSQEPPFRHLADKAFSDLLWYVLMRTVEVPRLRNQGWRPGAIASAAMRNWFFMLEGRRHRDADLWATMSPLLHDLEQTLLRRLPASADTQVSMDSALLAISIFHEVREQVVQCCPELEAFASAINVQYLQV